MHLINIFIHNYDQIAHAIILVLVLLSPAFSFAQTAPYSCPVGQMVNQQLANTGQSCSTLSYAALTNQPAIPAAQVNSDWNAVSGVQQILNEPTNVSAFTNDAGYITNSALASFLTIGSASSTYLTQSNAASTYATQSSVSEKFTIPTGSATQFLNGTGVPTNWVNADWNAASGSALILNKPTISVNQAYENTTQRLNPILINKTVAVAGGAGNAIFNLTNDGTSTGTALCPNGVMLNSPNLSVNDATAPYQFSWAWSNSNKTMTVLAQKASGLAVLTFTLLGIPAPVPNGTNVNETTICY